MVVLIAAGGCVPRGPLTKLDAPVRLAVPAGDSYLQAGKRMLGAGEPQLALSAFTRSLAREGATVEAYTGAGIAAAQRGLMTEARRHFEHARDLAPRSVVAQNNLGVVLFALGKYPEARQAFQAAFALSDGANDIAVTNLAKTEAALAEAEQAAAPDPAVTHDLRRLGSNEYQLIGVEG